ncbi:LolA-related protein [Noviherbaspirillum pedocola]|uniref:Outer membrane lipoprotein carrier protein LolA n=1 Tax=Noviherbaspirillum pedocola TaxID=2801341 RepID=A0A934T0R8_9BURK|nr:LolA-related protein [Noviherbaspirillum pedocola]MBK4736697.1 outer membrane lipoprotein carrier protein LolA [Noviherbaspirillum pedocola]
MIERYASHLVRALSALLLLTVVNVAVAAEAAWNIDSLMAALGRVGMGRADFTETKTIAMLDKPVESSGQLFYVAPDKLQKRTVKPKPEELIIEGNTLTIDRAGRTMTMAVDSAPELAGFVDSIRGTLAGDRKALERSFALTLEGPPERWVLELKPRNERMARAVSDIRIYGSRDDVKRIETRQADGDRSVMTIRRVSAQ